MSAEPDSYSAAERKLLQPARGLLRRLYAPIVALFAALHVPPNAVSFSQVVLGIVVVALIPTHARTAFVLFVLAIALDGVDGALARETKQASRFGALFDQYCDHIREVTVVGGLALAGALNPLLAALYGLAYPGLNLTLYLCNSYRVPMPAAVKSYLIVYPAMFAYLWLKLDVLDAAVGLAIGLMGLAVAIGLVRLSRAMEPPAEATQTAARRSG